MNLREIFENSGRIVKGVNTTVDVGPDEIKTQAAKFGNTVDKDGYPPTHKRKVKGLSTNVLFNLGEGKFRTNDVEEFKPSNDALNDMKSKYLPDWEMLDHKTLQAKYVAQDHREAEAFVRIINRLSEKMDHFCEVTQDVAEVAVKTTTFDVKGLTILDFQIAMVIDKFAEDVDIKQVRMSGNFGMHENFADGRNPQDKGDSKRHGVPTKASVSTLRKVAKQGGRKGQLAHWMANMKSGKAKKK
jgi:pterin-4a-carbinolamine dehydratase